MNMINQTRQVGSVLMVSLVILLILTVLGVSGMNTTVLQERMAGNRQELSSAFQAAEAGLRDGEADVAASTYDITDFKINCTDGLCTPSTVGDEVWDGTDVVWGSHTQSGTNVIAYGDVTGVSDLPTYAGQPKYIIEQLHVPPGSSGDSVKAGFAEKESSVWYRITAIGYGKNGNAETKVQSTYRK